MVDGKHISYMARTFDDYRSEFLKFAQEYYPDIAPNLEDYSVGSWFVDLAASIGDNLSYYVDRAYQDTNVNDTESRPSVLNMARTNGFKVPGPKASVMELELRCIIPILGTSDNSEPDWSYAPKVLRDTEVSCGEYKFRLAEDVDFSEQFNSHGYSNRKYVPVKNQNGGIVAYQVRKSVLGYGHTPMIYKQELGVSDIKPFMDIVLPGKNVCNVESVIFKENVSVSYTPDVSSFYIDEEEYRWGNEAITTHRFFETDSLSDQFRFGTELSRGDEEGVYKSVEIYDDYCVSGGTYEKFSRIYRGKWKPITQKFITEYTDNGYLKIIFGPGVAYDEIPETASQYGKYQMCRIQNNSLLGVLPKAGWTMFVLYNVSNGVLANLPSGSVNNVSSLKYEMKEQAVNQSMRGAVVKSISVTNITDGYCGKDMPSTDEIKWAMKYDTSSQNRAVTVKDYRAKIFSMPAKYGSVYRCQVAEQNNKVSAYMLNVNHLGKLDSVIPQTYVNNVIEYISHYRTIGDYVELKSGRVVNIGVVADLFIDKTYDSAAVVRNVIDTVSGYFDISKHDMGDEIFLGDMEKEITMLDGVLSIIGLKVYCLYDGSYSRDKSTLPRKRYNSACDSNLGQDEFQVQDGRSFEIDIDASEYLLAGEPDMMYEIKYPERDINIRIKTK